MIPISPIDYYFYRPSHYTIQFVFEYLGSIDGPALRKSIEIISKEFGPVRHQIRQVSPTELILVDHSDSIPFVLDHLTFELDLADHQVLLGLIDPVVTGIGLPLVKIKLTTTPLRSYVGVSFSHLLGDGYSLTMFMQALSEVCLGTGSTFSPGNNREALVPKIVDESGRALDRLFAETGNCLYVEDEGALRQTKSETVEFQQDELESLKNEAATANEKVTENDVVMAALFQRFCGRLPAAHDGRRAVRCPVDFRRSVPGLSANYFGNAVKEAVASFPDDNLSKIGFPDLVKSIRQAISNVTPESVRQTLACLDQLRRQEGLGIFKDLGSPGLLVTNLSRMPFQSLDLGIGAPVQFYVATFPPRVAIITRSVKG